MPRALGHPALPPCAQDARHSRRRAVHAVIPFGGVGGVGGVAVASVA
jgi:hypothetical protein